MVLLSPGVHNPAYFEHAFLARKMGIELVEGRDLFCHEHVLYMRSLGGRQRVDVVYRRVNDDFLDPVHFRPDSVVGCPGILNAARAGNVTIANAVGNGVADDKLTYTYVPALIEYYLGEKPLLPNVTTYRLDDPDVREECLERLDQLVVKPVDGSGGAGIVIGPHASDAELAAVREQVLAEPRAWIAQELVLLSTSPSQVDDRLLPRHIDLRPFAVNDGEQVQVLPGGLTRVALREGSLIVNSSQGGGSKDTWVLTSSPQRASEADRSAGFPRAGGAGHRPRPRPARRPAAAVRGPGMLSRVAESLFWIGRYVERAEDTARLLDVHFHEVLEDPTVDEAGACAVLLTVMGVPDDIARRHRDSRAVLELLGYDDDTPTRSSARWSPPGRTPAARGRRSRPRSGSA